jgi:hypothetical protein
VQLKLEGSDDAEIAATAPQRPKEAGFSFSLVRNDSPSAVTTSAEMRLSIVSLDRKQKRRGSQKKIGGIIAVSTGRALADGSSPRPMRTGRRLWRPKPLEFPRLRCNLRDLAHQHERALERVTCPSPNRKGGS